MILYYIMHMTTIHNYDSFHSPELICDVAFFVPFLWLKTVTARTCLEPTVEHGEIFHVTTPSNKPKFAVGTRVLIHCNSGYWPSTYPTIWCVDPVVWSLPVPKCLDHDEEEGKIHYVHL